VADVVALFEEYAAAYARGERPQAREYLERAGAGADELAGLISAWLRAVPVPRPDADGTALVGALAAAEPPLLALRVEQGVRVEEVVDALVDGLELDRAKRGKVKRYYQRLEHGLLEPSGVSRQVWDILKKRIGAGAERAASWAAPPLTLGQAAYLRSDEPLLQRLSTPAESDGGEQDDIDRLFTGGVP